MNSPRNGGGFVSSRGSFDTAEVALRASVPVELGARAVCVDGGARVFSFSRPRVALVVGISDPSGEGGVAVPRELLDGPWFRQVCLLIAGT